MSFVCLVFVGSQNSTRTPQLLCFNKWHNMIWSVSSSPGTGGHFKLSVMAHSQHFESAGRCFFMHMFHSGKCVRSVKTAGSNFFCLAVKVSKTFYCWLLSSLSKEVKVWRAAEGNWTLRHIAYVYIVIFLSNCWLVPSFRCPLKNIEVDVMLWWCRVEDLRAMVWR